MGDWLFVALVGAAAVHIFEEYVYPGGFQDALRKVLPRMATPFLSPKFHLVVNGLFLLLCFSSAFIGKSNLVFTMSVFSLVFVNSVLHIRGAIVTKKYYPGVISGVFIYIPLAIYAYYVFLSSGQLTYIRASFSLLLGVLYMGTPVIYVLIQNMSKAGRERSTE